MKLRLPGRRDAAETTPSSSDATSGDPVPPQVRAGSKGRPTPKRHEAQGRRPGPVPPPPTTRKEAYKRLREQQSSTRAQNRRAMLAGDEAYLPARDRGPVRKLARDIVDSRRNVGGLFLAVAGIALVGTVVPSLAVRTYATFVLFSYFLVLVADSVVLGRRISRTIAARFPDEQRRRGVVWYGISRATMVRRWRFPKPEVPVGAQV